MPDDIRILDDPEKIKIAIVPTRRKILELLRFNDLTVSQMVGILGKDQSTIYRHVEKLLKADFIRQSGERKEHHIPEKIYGRTARMFFLAPGVGALSGEEVIVQHRKEMYDKTTRLLRRMNYADTGETQTLGREFYTEIEAIIQSKIKEVAQDNDLDFDTIRRLRTTIMIIEMHRNPRVGELARKYAESFI